MQFTKALQHTIVWKALNTILIFCINLLLVRILGAESSGEFFFAVTALSFFMLILSGSVESGITYYGSNDPANIASLSLFVLPWLLLQALASWLLLRLLAVNLDHDLSWLFIISNLAILYFSALYYSKKWFLSVNLFAFIVNAIVLAALCWIYFQMDGKRIVNTAYFYEFTARIYFGGFLLQAILLMLFFFTRTKLPKRSFANSTQLIKRVFKYSGIAFISNIIFFLVTRIDYFFVEKFCDEAALSNYVQASKMGQLFILLPTMIASVLFPYSSGMESKEYLHKLQSVCRIITALSIPVSLVVIAGGYWIFPWLFGRDFTQMYTAMIWYLPGFYSLSLVTLLAAYLAGRAMLTTNLLASAIALMIVIAGDILLIPLYGINAAAGVSSAAYLVCLIYLLTVYKNRLGCRYRHFFSFKKADIFLLLNNFKK